jgi:oligoribonuclease
MLVWFDCETTGLDPALCAMLEVAVVLTDDALTERAVFTTPILFRGHIPNEWARKQHEKSGLLAECYAAKKGTGEIEGEILEFLRTHGVAEKAGVLAGSSIHFDRSFIRSHMPRLDAHLHYRMADVSSLNELSSRFARPVYEGRPTVPKEQIAHRALADIRASIGTLRYYLDRGLFGLDAGKVA